MKKLVTGGYIMALGDTISGTEITHEEEKNIRTAMSNRPAYREGYGLRLRNADLTWEEYAVPVDPEPVVPTVEDKAEAYDILTGVSE